MSTASRVIKNTGFLYVRMIATLFVSLWTTRIILDALGDINFGIYNVVGGTIALLGFLNAALATSTQRFLNVDEGKNDLENQRVTFNCSFFLHLGLGILLGILFLLSGVIFFNGILDIPAGRENAAKFVYLALTISTVFTVISVPYEATMNAHENMKWYAIIGIFEVIMKLVIAYAILFTNNDRLIVYSILMAFVPICSLTAMRVYCHRNYKECIVRPRKYFDKSRAKELAWFAGWNMLNSISSMTTQYGLNIVVNHYFGVILNAAQGIANQVSGVLTALSQNALKALNPIIYKSGGENNDLKMNYISLLGCKMTYSIFALFSFPIISYMPQILKLWLVDVPDWAVLFCQLQLIRMLTEFATLSLTTSIMAQGNVRNYNLAKSIVNIAPLIIVPVMFAYGSKPYWLYIIWIVAWSLCGGIINIIYSRILNHMSLRSYFSEVLVPISCITFFPCLILAADHFLTSKSEWLVGCITLFLYLNVFSIMFWKIVLSSRERDAIYKLITKVKRNNI